MFTFLQRTDSTLCLASLLEPHVALQWLLPHTARKHLSVAFHCLAQLGGGFLPWEWEHREAEHTVGEEGEEGGGKRRVGHKTARC